MTGLREAQGLYYAGAASVLDSDASGISESLRGRARRLWSDQGVVLLPRELADPRLAPDAEDEQRPRPGTASLLHVVEALATAVDLADRPHFLARELLACVERSASPLEAEIVVAPRDTPPPASTHAHVALPLGTDGDDSYTFVCRVPEDSRDALLLNSILTIVRAALALERARHVGRRRDAIWPAAEVNHGADAVFISEQMQALLAAVIRIAPTTVPVLITGETGTGKEVLARAIHARSNRAQATFLPFSCSGVPKDMLDSQLFGYRKGAFTGAAEQFPGVIRSASGGTLFLDEIADIPLEVQPKLLRFLESGEVHPIGESKPIKVDVRVIAATNAEIEPMIAAGTFRQDLFYRLNIVRLSVAPLRERRVEIPALADYYLRKYSLEYLKSDLRLAEETMEYLLLYRWPGNVRQLANEMRRLAALAEAGAVLMPEHLSPEIAASRRTVPASERTLDPTELVVRLDQPLNAVIEHVERAAIDYALQHCAGHLDDTAHMLGLSRKGLYLKRQRLGLVRSEGAEAGITRLS
jgi:DNA-binding NtrC family response regulator